MLVTNKAISMTNIPNFFKSTVDKYVTVIDIVTKDSKFRHLYILFPQSLRLKPVNDHCNTICVLKMTNS